MTVQEIIDLCVKEDITIIFKYTKGREALLKETENHKGCGIGVLSKEFTKVWLYPPSECTYLQGQAEIRPTPNYLF